MWLCSSSRSIIENRGPSVHSSILTIRVSKRRRAAVRVGDVKAGTRNLIGLQPGQRTHRSLERPAHAVGERIIKDAITRPDSRLAAARGVPGNTEAWHQTLVVVRRYAPRYARIARKH